MTRNDLIATVALDLIKEHLDQEPEGSQRFCMLGLEPSIVRSIAGIAHEHPETKETLLVKISPEFDPENSLPLEILSEESITHWRHCRLPAGARAVLFAASQEELQRNDKSVEKITKIESDTLRTRYESWIKGAGLTSIHIDDEKQKQLITALSSANQTHAARTIEAFGDFVLAISDSYMNQGLPLQKAVDNALPALKLPRNSGNFDRIAEKKRAQRPEWNKLFRQLQNRVRPLLVAETERGDPIPRDQLRANFEEISDRFDAKERAVIESFLNADLKIDDWSTAQKSFVELDWRKVSELFDGVTKTASLTLAEKTIKFFDDEFTDQLDDDDRELLSNGFPKDPTDDLQTFFEANREHLARDKKLTGAWERYIYRNPETYSDFLIGLMETIDNLRLRVSDDDLSARKLLVRIPNAGVKSFWRSKNTNIVRYFAFRYRGLQKLLGDSVSLDFGKLYQFYFPDVEDDDLLKATSGAKDARSIKFEVVLDPEGANAKLLFYWEMPVNAIATAMPDDLINVANLKFDRAILPTADIVRQSVSAKGSIQRISLEDVNTIRDAANTNVGRLVSPNSTAGDCTEAFLSELDYIGSIIGDSAITAVSQAFEAFAKSYTKALREWVALDGSGIYAEAFIEQAECYSDLLGHLLDHANYDRARETLWQHILRIGLANIGAGTPAAIITPWHPLRMLEIAIKARQAASLIKDVLHAKEDDIFRADLLFEQTRLELTSIYYPEICIGFDKNRADVLVSANTYFDYTLAEPPFRAARPDAEDALDIDPTVAARVFSGVGEQYLKLLPHERSNFSMVLYNSESKALPSALASELSNKVEQENELQCDLLLSHSDPKRIRTIYEQQNVSVSDDTGSVMASEAARNFLSRLRVGFLDAGNLPTDDSDKAADIVALNDVVARNANLVWKRAPGDRNPDLLDHVPARWSRRRPLGAADTASSVYLSCPSQPQVGQRYLNLIQSFIYGDNALPGDVVPAREVNFRDGHVEDLFRQVHRIGEWIVNFDELVDRRLLNNNGVNVIRHIHDRHFDRNIVVSTTSKPRLLRVLIKDRLEHIDPAITNENEEVIDRLIDRANELSGQVVMRAARYGHYANELLGVVLSMEQIRSGFGGASLPIGWYFLDDFASWFGQREEQIADIMAIAPRFDDGMPVLEIAISEAKFVNSGDYKSHAKKSAKQLEETVARIGRALDPSHKRIDRKVWLHRLGDFMIEGIEPFDADLFDGWDLHKWSDEVRQDNVPIRLVGFSHVFVHDDHENVDAGGAIPLKGMPHCTQEIFGKSNVAEKFRRFAATGDRASKTAEGKFDEWPTALTSTRDTTTGTPHKASTDEIAESPKQTDLSKSSTNSRRTPPSNTAPTPQAESVKDPEQDQPSVGVSPLEANSNSEIVAHLANKWPSRQLAEWVSRGRTVGEEGDDAQGWLDTTVTALQRALRGYDMTAELVGSRLTPNAALVRFRGSDDLTVPKVEKKRQELLTSHAVDVINVLAAPMEIIIMVRRPKRAILHLRDLWRQRELPETAPESNTSLLLGAKESDGELLYLNVGGEFGGHQIHGPHTLIAGETGSGKGVLVQSLLLDICATNSPNSARIRMIDPKAGIDFPWLRKMPHLDGDLITEQDEAIQALQELVAEMERRNRLLADAGVTKLENYNRKVAPADRLPRIWLFHDELADWMMIDEYRQAVDLNASRLGVKARAAGINLVLITQRPDKDALPMQLRANLTNRLVLKVADKKNSMLVLDEPGAERLLGRGHLAAKLSGEGRVILAQVPFASEEDISELANLIAITS